MSALVTRDRPPTVPKPSTVPASAEPIGGTAPPGGAAESSAADAVPLGLLLRRAEQAIRAGVPDAVWVAASVAAVKSARGGWAVELTEPEAPRASAGLLRCYLPEAAMAAIRARTGQAVFAEDLAGMTVVINVSVELHRRWGLSGRIVEVAPGLEASLARKALEAAIARLRREALFDLQRQLAPPGDVTRIAIVHPANAAGWADVRSELVRWERAGLVAVRSTPVPFEGADAAGSIASALRRATEPLAERVPDVVMLVRGGGAASALVALDDEGVARAIALCPIPVVTGLGHAVDSTLADLVAWRTMHTPSKAVGLLRDLMSAAARRVRSDHAAIVATVSVALDRAAPGLDALERRVSADVLRHTIAKSGMLDGSWAQVRASTEAARERLARQVGELEHLATDMATASPAIVDRAAFELTAVVEAVLASARRAGEDAPDGVRHLSTAAVRAEALLAAAEAQLATFRRVVPTAAQGLADRSAAQISALFDKTQRLAGDRIGRTDDGAHHAALVKAVVAERHRVDDAELERLRRAVTDAVGRRIDAAAAALEMIAATLDAADPAEVLRLGYALVMDRNDRPVTTAEAAIAASSLILRFADGTVVARLIDPNS